MTCRRDSRRPFRILSFCVLLSGEAFKQREMFAPTDVPPPLPAPPAPLSLNPLPLGEKCLEGTFKHVNTISNKQLVQVPHPYGPRYMFTLQWIGNVYFVYQDQEDHELYLLDEKFEYVGFIDRTDPTQRIVFTQETGGFVAPSVYYKQEYRQDFRQADPHPRLVDRPASGRRPRPPRQAGGGWHEGAREMRHQQSEQRPVSQNPARFAHEHNDGGHHGTKSLAATGPSKLGM